VVLLALCGTPTPTPAQALMMGAPADGELGAYVATDEQLLTALDTDSAIDIYERKGGSLSLLTLGVPSCRPACGNAESDVEALDGIHGLSGDRLLFSTAESLTPVDTDAATDIYLRSGDSLELVSQGPNGFNGEFDAKPWSSNDDGSAVVFTTAEPLVGADTDASSDIYMRSGGATTLVSQGPQGFNGAFESIPAAHSRNEAVIVFRTREQLVGADTDNSIDVYERHSGTTGLVSQGPSGFNGAFDAESKVLTSEDGSRIAFSTAEPLIKRVIPGEPGDFDEDDKIDVYKRDGGTTQLISTFEYTPFNGDFDMQLEALSPNLDQAFFSTPEVLTEYDTDTFTDIYERLSTKTELVSWPLSQLHPEPFAAEFLRFHPQQTAAGGVVFFSTMEKISKDDTDSQPDIYARSNTGFMQGTTTQVTQGEAGFNGPYTATLGSISADGTRVFLTTAERLVGADTDSSVDLYERIAGQMTALVSDGEVNGGGPFDVTSAGGIQRPLFATAEQLVPGDTDSTPDLYQRSNGETRLVSTGKPSPPPPAFSGSNPPTPADSTSPFIQGTAEPGSTVRLHADPGCGGTPLAAGNAAEFASPGLAVSVPTGTSANIYAVATDANNNPGPCTPTPFIYTANAAKSQEPPVSPPPPADTTAPQTTIRGGPIGWTTDATPTFRFTASEPGATFRCKLDARPAGACASPFTTPRLKPMRHTIAVTSTDAAGNVDPTPASRKFLLQQKRRKRSH
jgi:hypothetical protein